MPLRWRPHASFTDQAPAPICLQLHARFVDNPAVCHHNLEPHRHSYFDRAHFAGTHKGLLVFTAVGCTGLPFERPLMQTVINRVIRRHAIDAGIDTKSVNRSLQATGISE